jgi:hypothetical protein
VCRGGELRAHSQEEALLGHISGCETTSIFESIDDEMRLVLELVETFSSTEAAVVDKQEQSQLECTLQLCRSLLVSLHEISISSPRPASRTHVGPAPMMRISISFCCDMVYCICVCDECASK